MDSASLTTSATLEQWNSLQNVWQPVPVKVNVEGKTMRLDPYPSDPNTLLATGNKFKVTVTTGAKNVAGIALASTKSWTFTTTKDGTAPKVSKVSPAAGKTGVSRSTNITATFSEKMDPSTAANAKNFMVANKSSSTPLIYAVLRCTAVCTFSDL